MYRTRLEACVTCLMQKIDRLLQHFNLGMKLERLIIGVFILVSGCSYKSTRRQALNGDIVSIHMLVDMYFENPTSENLRKAEFYVDKGIQQNDGYCMYLKAKLVKSDTAKREWYIKSAERNIVEAMYFLGFMYSEGKGGGRNIDSAVYWLSIASLRGHCLASESLAGIYYYKSYGRQNHDSAFYLYSKACYQTYKPSRTACDKVLELISQERVSNIDSLQRIIVEDKLKDMMKNTHYK